MGANGLESKFGGLPSTPHAACFWKKNSFIPQRLFPTPKVSKMKQNNVRHWELAQVLRPWLLEVLLRESPEFRTAQTNQAIDQPSQPKLPLGGWGSVALFPPGNSKDQTAALGLGRFLEAKWLSELLDIPLVWSLDYSFMFFSKDWRKIPDKVLRLFHLRQNLWPFQR